MRRRSSKTAAVYREWKPVRLEFLRSGPCCECGGRPDDVHEIVGGGSRMAAFIERATWLRVCRSCHADVQYMSKPKQMALKLMSDPLYFDLEKVCEVWGRAPSAIDIYEVLEELKPLLERKAA